MVGLLILTGLPKLAFLIGGGLAGGGDPEVEGGATHRWLRWLWRRRGKKNNNIVDGKGNKKQRKAKNKHDVGVIPRSAFGGHSRKAEIQPPEFERV